MNGKHEITVVIARDQGGVLEEFDAEVERLNTRWSQLRGHGRPLIVKVGPHYSALTTYVFVADGTAFNPYLPHTLAASLRESFVAVAERILPSHDVVQVAISDPLHTFEITGRHHE